MPRLKFKLSPGGSIDETGITVSFTDGNGKEAQTWFGSPPEHIDHVGLHYLTDRLPNCKKESHATFIKRRYREEFSAYTQMPDLTYQLSATVRKLTKKDRQFFLRNGMPYSDLDQIERAIDKTTFTVDDRQISFEEAVDLLGRDEILLGLGRSAYHYTTCRQSENGTLVYFDSRALFD